jgi:hypothetical protein
MSETRTNVVQHYRTVTANNPPAANVLAEGEIGIEMDDPMRLWIGVPASLDATGRKLLFDTSLGAWQEAPTDGQTYGRDGEAAEWLPVLPLTGGTLTGPLLLSGAATNALGAVTLAQMQAAIAGGASLTVGPTPPASPTQGAMWWDSVGGQLYVYYNDGSSSQWVAASNASGIADAPSDANTYGRHATAWLPVAPIASPALSGTPTAPTNGTATDASTQIATDAFVQAAAKVAVAPSLNNVGRNLLHNALFNVQQRGTGPWTVGGYTADRWNLQTTGDAANAQIAAQIDAGRTAIGDESCQSVMQTAVTGNAAAGSYSGLAQGIEHIRRLSGKTVTVSFWAYCGTAYKIGINILQIFGSGGSPAPAQWALATGAAVTLNTSWTRYSATIVMPTAAGQTFGTNGDDSAWLWLWLSSGATNAPVAGNIGVQTGTVDIWGVQLEVGSVATPLEKPDPQQDLARCQRFYSNISVSLVGYNGTGAPIGQTVCWPVTMRVAPSVTFSNPTYTNASGVTSGGASTGGALIYAVVTGTGAAQFSAFVTASADL